MKSDRYSSKEDKDDGLGSLANKLALDLRKNIRNFGNFPVLSEPWNEMASVLGRLATISDMESKLPSGKDDATLWETGSLIQLDCVAIISMFSLFCSVSLFRGTSAPVFD